MTSCLASLCLACAVIAAVLPPTSADEATLTQLNQQYVASFLKADANWYSQHTTDDFVCIEPDGTMLDKAAFLRDAAKGPGETADYRLVDVRIRVIGDTALIHAQGLATRKDGTTNSSRYTDVYVRVKGEWKAASAQITGIRQAAAHPPAKSAS